MKENEKRLEEHLLEMTKLKEQRDKELLTLEVFIGIVVSFVMFVLIVEFLILTSGVPYKAIPLHFFQC